MLIGSPANRRYLSGFSGSAGWLAVFAAKAYLAVDFRYVEQAKRETNNLEILHVKGDLSTWMPSTLLDNRAKRVGIEGEHVSFYLYLQLRKICKEIGNHMRIISTQNVVESMRMFKDASEIDNIQKAANISDMTMEFARSYCLREGITEKQLAWELESFMREHNSESIPFEIIAASGANAALPHAKPTDKIILKGEPITIDLGAKVNGYCSDVTRTFIIGQEDTTFNNIYNIVLGAQLFALSTIKAGMSGDSADKIVRKIIDDSGYSDAFGHGLGHGVGLETHELPRLSAASNEILAENMVFTIEPGIYLSGWGGVRIEDTVTIKSERPMPVNHAPKIACIQGG